MITIRCSSIERVLNCAHSLFLPVEKSDNFYSEEGNKEHQIAFEFLVEGDKDKKKVLWDKMNPNTQLYCKYVNSLIKKGYKVHLEKTYKRQFSNFILQGTPDCWYGENDLIEIVDLKNGYQEIEPFSNQLKGYALLVNTLEPFFKKLMSIKLTIIQHEEIKSVEFLETGLIDLIYLLDESIVTHRFETSRHCNFCPSKIHCLKMTEPIDKNDKIIERVKNKSYIKKMLDESEQKLYDERPEWFREKKWGKGNRRIFIGDSNDI